MLTTESLPIWNDYFIHGITINSFGSPFTFFNNMELVGVSRGFYHYAPFLIPSTFIPISNLSGLMLATSFLLPMGLLIATFGCYLFSTQLWGRSFGLVSVTLIICLPAYQFFIQSGWFDFNWLLIIAPGSGYAIGIGLLISTGILIYCNTPDKRIIFFSLMLL